ncbi:MAG: sulfate/molybdate ABC transporter ATP-binding protein [Acidimicrobiia bacterium]
MSLVAAMSVQLGSLDLEVSLTLSSDETVVLLGPNGAGKTTALRTLAGLIALDAGWIVLDEETLDDPAGGVFVAAERRPVGVVFQDYLLFPHMSALENVAFGLRARGVRRGEARTRAAQWLDRVGLADRASSRPSSLSGGQAQRVALGRALAIEPRMLLLDEPLAALDASTRVELRRALRQVLRSFGGVRLMVTHDPIEAIALADRVIVLESGRISQEGTPAELRERPRTRYVADLVGVNLLAGYASGRQVTISDGGGELTIAEPADGDVLVVIAPHAVALFHDAPSGSPRNAWEGTVAHVDPEGDRVRVGVAGPVPITAEVTRAAVAELTLTEGSSVWVSVKATEITVQPA